MSYVTHYNEKNYNYLYIDPLMRLQVDPTVNRRRIYSNKSYTVSGKLNARKEFVGLCVVLKSQGCKDFAK